MGGGAHVGFGSATCTIGNITDGIDLIKEGLHVGVIFPVGGIGLIAGAAFSNAYRSLGRRAIRTGPTDEVIADFGRVDQREGLGFDIVSGGIGTRDGATIQIIGNGIRSHAPRGRDGEIAIGVAIDRQSGLIGDGGTRFGSRPATKGVTTSGGRRQSEVLRSRGRGVFIGFIFERGRGHGSAVRIIGHRVFIRGPLGIEGGVGVLVEVFGRSAIGIVILGSARGGTVIAGERISCPRG